MNRAELIRRLKDEGCILIRDGGKHDWSNNPKPVFPRRRLDTQT
jgi:hypothetical protein